MTRRRCGEDKFPGINFLIDRQQSAEFPLVSDTPTAYYVPQAGSGGTIADGWLSSAISRITSIALAAPAQFSVSGSPLTANGTLTLAWATQAANIVLAGPTTGAAAAPTFRALVAADIPNLDSAKITTGEIPRSPLTTRGDLLTQNPSGTHTRLAVGTVGTYLRSDGTDPSWSSLLFADLTYTGLTTGQVLRATGATSAAFGALDLANSSAVTGLLAPANGGTGINNGTNTLTIPASGTAALRASAATAGRVAFWSDAQSLSHDSALFWDNTNKRLGLGTTTPSSIFHIVSESGAEQFFEGYFDTGAVTMSFRRAGGSRASPTTIGSNKTMGALFGRGYASTPADFYRGAQISFEVDGSATNAGDIPGRIAFYVHVSGAGNDTVSEAMRLSNDLSALLAKQLIMQEMTAPAAPSTNQGSIYLEDNGAGKTRLMVKFNTGAAQQIAIQP